MTNGRRKGSKGELEVAKLVQAWWSLHRADVKFVRTPLSGGWSSAQVRGEFRASGDLMTTDPAFPFSIEVKRREAFTWRNVLEGRRSPLWGWWDQAQAQGVEAGLEPLLWARRAGEDWRIVAKPLLAVVLHRLRVPARLLREVQAPGGRVVVFPAACLLTLPPGDVAAGIPTGTGRAKVPSEVSPDGTSPQV